MRNVFPSCVGTYTATGMWQATSSVRMLQS